MDAEVISALQTPDNPYSIIIGNNARYLLDELLADVDTGHNVIATVFVDAHAMYRASGPEAMKSVGEVEFANGVAAMSASGTYGKCQACAGIVSGGSLHEGDGAEQVLEAHIRAGNGRFRGVRNPSAYDPDPDLAGAVQGNPAHMLEDKKFRTGFKYLQKFGLTYDTWVLEPQLPEVIDLARAFPETSIILDHVGTPLGMGSYKGKRGERYDIWRENMRTLSACTNVTVKVGGLAMPICGFDSFNTNPCSEMLAAEWKPYVEPCIEFFGAERCMFESNFPVDSGGGSYPAIWNAFKRLASGASKEEKTALFSGTAARVYKLDL